MWGVLSGINERTFSTDQQGEKLFFRPADPDYDEVPPQDTEPRILSKAEEAAELCASLLDPYEDAKAVVHRICGEYNDMDVSEKQEFQKHLAMQMGAKLTPENIASLWDVLSTKGGNTPAPLLLHQLMLAATPSFNGLFQIFALQGEIEFLLKFRSELLIHMASLKGAADQEESVGYLKVVHTRARAHTMCLPFN